MNVLLLNGSPHKDGCTNAALEEICTTLKAENVETEIFWLGAEPVRDCIACGACAKLAGRCVFKDKVNEFLEKAERADGFIFGTPVYYAHPTGSVLAALNRIFYAGGEHLAYKPGAAVASARRAGTTASLDVLNKYFTINNMPVVSSRYWNMVHGLKASDVQKDAEGLQVMRTLGRNMAWLLKCLEAGKKAGVAIPAEEEPARTNFIRD